MILLKDILKEIDEKDYPLDGKIDFQGIPIEIENKTGTYRNWKNKHSESGKTLMRYHYGRVPKTKTTDGDMIDVYIGPNKESNKVFVINQNDPKTNKFDEPKTMLGFDSSKEAKKAYLMHYNNSKFYGGMKELNIEEFKNKLKSNISRANLK